jgi:hypothetical protein
MWKEAAAVLSLEPNEAARVTSKLGHVEFDWMDGRFACAPTALVGIPELDGYLLLSGARPLGEQERLRDLARSSELDIEVSDPFPQPRERGPATVLVECSPADGEAFAELAGLELERSPELLAMSLPEFKLELIGELRSPDDRFAHCLVDPETLHPRWGARDVERADGLWLFYSFRQRAEHYLHRDGEWWFLPSREYGPYLVTEDIEPALLEYDPANRLLYVRGRAPLPPLQARAATLCSGRMPLVRPLGDDTQETYVNVSPDIAEALAKSLGTRLHQEGET